MPLVPDKRTHRGAHPEDEYLFHSNMWPTLRAASGDLCWLLSHGYASPSSLKLVGDRYSLTKRQRIAVGRCACAGEAAARRQQCRVEPEQLAGRQLWIDGYNVLTSIEAALAGGVILAARDGCYRDMASVHGSYRKVEETIPALRLLGEQLEQWNIGPCRWLLDSPVSNSGRLKAIITDVAAQSGWNWDVELVHNPDTILATSEHVVATSDSVILDQCRQWLNLARAVITRHVPDANVVDLQSS